MAHSTVNPRLAIAWSKEEAGTTAQAVRTLDRRGVGRRAGGPSTPTAGGATVAAVDESLSLARIARALDGRPGWRVAAPQYFAASGLWRATAYDTRARSTASGALSATGATRAEALERLAELVGPEAPAG
jgi:hypothetical protein